MCDLRYLDLRPPGIFSLQILIQIFLLNNCMNLFYVDTVLQVGKPMFEMLFCQCFGFGFSDSGSESSILGCKPIRIRIEGFDDKKLKKIDR